MQLPQVFGMKSLEQILSYTKKNGDCLEWTRCLNTDGYARMAWNGSTNGKVHRIVAELSGMDIEGLVVRHTCDNIKCINPDHLIPGTTQENTQDRVNRDRGQRTVRCEVVSAVMDLWLTGKYSKAQIADIVGIDFRRVGEVVNGHRDHTGRLTAAYKAQRG